jgi:hypothetical protein
MFVKRTAEDLKEHVQGCVAELVFNRDEVGISDWEDRKTKTKTVIVPATMRDQTIHHEISRIVKHISVIAWASAAGESLTPYIITWPASRPVQKWLKKDGVRFGPDFVSRSIPSPYINAEIFLDYIRTVFLPTFGELRTLAAFTEETGVLLMDNCPSHLTDDMIGLLTEARVRVITFAPHTTQIFQVLDVTLFDVLKRRLGYKLPFEDEKEVVRFIVKVHHDFEQTMVESNIWRAFRAIEFEFDTEAEPYRLLFKAEKLRQSEGCSAPHCVLQKSLMIKRCSSFSMVSPQCFSQTLKIQTDESHHESFIECSEFLQFISECQLRYAKISNTEKRYRQ